jgi:hypothetical protein
MQESESMFKGDFASGEPWGEPLGENPVPAAICRRWKQPADSRRNVSPGPHWQRADFRWPFW